MQKIIGARCLRPVCERFICSQSIKDVCNRSKFSRIEGWGGGGVGEGPDDRKKS